MAASAWAAERRPVRRAARSPSPRSAADRWGGPGVRGPRRDPVHRGPVLAGDRGAAGRERRRGGRPGRVRAHRGRCRTARRVFAGHTRSSHRQVTDSPGKRGDSVSGTRNITAAIRPGKRPRNRCLWISTAIACRYGETRRYGRAVPALGVRGVRPSGIRAPENRVKNSDFAVSTSSPGSGRAARRTACIAGRSGAGARGGCSPAPATTPPGDCGHPTVMEAADPDESGLRKECFGPSTAGHACDDAGHEPALGRPADGGRGWAGRHRWESGASPAGGRRRTARRHPVRRTRKHIRRRPAIQLCVTIRRNFDVNCRSRQWFFHRRRVRVTIAGNTARVTDAGVCRDRRLHTVHHSPERS